MAISTRAITSKISGTAAERALALRIWPGAIGWVHDDSPFPAWVPSAWPGGVHVGRSSDVNWLSLNSTTASRLILAVSPMSRLSLSPMSRIGPAHSR